MSEKKSIESSTLVIPVPEMRTKWERLWPKDEKELKSVTNRESFVRSRVQRYSVVDSHQISKQIGYVNTVNTARVYSDGDETWCWVIHNKLPPNSGKISIAPKCSVFTSTCFIQPSCNQ